jgi:hypothetical protein
MGVTDKTNACLERLKVDLCFMGREDVIPLIGIFRGGMNERQVVYDVLEREGLEVFEIFLGEYLVRPVRCCSGMTVKMFGLGEIERRLVVISQEDATGPLFRDVDTFVWVCTVANEVSKADDLVDFFFVNYLKGFLESFEI